MVNSREIEALLRQKGTMKLKEIAKHFNANPNTVRIIMSRCRFIKIRRIERYVYEYYYRGDRR